ncbi:putative non-specific serine/threonine protein kinase [Rosa chinensis]|uniref:Putative non-specific serine/threonine protein kinase n=1 Tax=Rosa chinensis TaxID=74649 RepID=A0A2P6RCP6_ROSCH|nr:putative non-specific serine/threonine protein kinase [Rosa chinensis]
MYYMVSYNTNVIKRTRLLNSGLYQHLTWNDADHQWTEDFAAPRYRCDWYAHCGANSKCSPDNTLLFEGDCLPGYEPKYVNKWNQNDGSDGCVSKQIDASKCEHG